MVCMGRKGQFAGNGAMDGSSHCESPKAQTQANGVDSRTLYPLGYLAGTSLFYRCFLDSQI